MPNITICRTLFCPRCFKKGWPYMSQHFAVYRGTREEVDILTVKKRFWELEKQIGFTPHILWCKRKIKKGPMKGMFEMGSICTMDGCGLKIILKDGLYSFAGFLSENNLYMSKDTLKSLCAYSDSDYHLDKIEISRRNWYPGKDQRAQRSYKK